MRLPIPVLILIALQALSGAPQKKAAAPAKPAAKPQAAPAAFVAPEPAPFDASTAAQGWVQLFDGDSLFGWTAEAGAEWKAEKGTLHAAKAGWLVTNARFADFRLRLQYRLAEPVRPAAVIVRASGDPAAKDAGMLVPLSGGKLPGAGQWHAMNVSVRGSQLVVRIDGKVVQSSRDFRFREGSIALSGTGAEFRSIHLRPLDLACLFNGKDLTGWREVAATPAAKEPAVWTVQDGAIHVEKGPGQLETVTAHGNFVLQADVRTNSKDEARHPNSGIFFRGDRGIFWSGYESQIRNEHAAGDAAKPVDYGTGGVYGSQAARRIVARDNEWFTKTIVAAGRTISVWVDGVPVTSWTDPRPEGLSVKAGQARLMRGTISLQAHDPSTNLDFRNLCIGDLP